MPNLLLGLELSPGLEAWFTPLWLIGIGCLLGVLSVSLIWIASRLLSKSEKINMLMSRQQKNRRGDKEPQFFINTDKTLSETKKAVENVNEINIVFPKYLFMKKDKFIEIYKKLNYERISRIIVLIKKTEILLRKNTTMHLIITQRFLLNLKKTIG